MSGDEIRILGFTLGMAALAMLAILPPGMALAWVLARRAFPGKAVVETLVALPLVMPPVATGLFLLRLFGRRSAFGRFLHERFDLEVIFTWRGVLIAMAVMSLPLFVRSARVAFEEVPRRLEQIARTLGASPARAFLTITLPLAARGLTAGLLLAFARALGEFGATIVVAGNIPGRTQTSALAIYQLIQLGRDDAALRLCLAAAVLAFLALFASERLLARKATS